MQYSTILLSALAATGVIAAPKQRRAVDNEIRVILSDLGETGAQNTFKEGVRDTQRPSQRGPYKTVELQIGKDVKNQAYRCGIFDNDNKPIVVLRGANTDTTFSDADKGAWNFRTPTEVSSVVCDPTFKAVGADAAQIRVILSNQGTETGSQTVFTKGGQREEKPPVGSTGPYETVELRVGELVEKQDLRCQILDKMNKPITVIRGQNIDTTFSDADKGAWTFKAESEVSKAICDGKFVANPQ